VRNSEQVFFGSGGIDRHAQLRGDTAAIGRLAAAPEARAVPFWRGKAALRLGEPTRLAWVPLDHPVIVESGGERVFLGCAGGAGRFAVDVSVWEDPDADEAAMRQFRDPSLNRHPALGPDVAFAELRSQMATLDPGEAGVAAAAKGVLGWHATHRFCARCGAASEMAEGGWRRACPACGGQHFPRTDPVVIMLVTHGERVLLGRQAVWPPGMVSLLAGFVEPGETIEAAVRRETFEEAGIVVGAVRYLASQPWPFPSSLMIGCHGEALTEKIERDPVELEAAFWASREAVLAGISGLDPDLKPARKGSIARFLLERWLAGALA
jgi:NAD+ diphosphatase